MPFDQIIESRPIAVIYGDVVGSRLLPDQKALQRSMRAATRRLNEIFAQSLVEPFSVADGDRIEGALTTAIEAPLCISVLRETLAPVAIRVGVGVGTVRPTGVQGSPRKDAFALSRQALEALARDGGLTRYAGSGEAAEVLLTGICRLADPLIAARTAKQWQAIAAFRALGSQHAVAAHLGVTRQSISDRLRAGHRREVEEADVAIATYLSFTHRQRVV